MRSWISRNRGNGFRGRAAIAAQPGGHPADRHFTVARISGNGDLWVSECMITYDGVPSCSVSIMEFSGVLVTHEAQYSPTPSTRPNGGQRWPSRCQTVQADAGDRESPVPAPRRGATGTREPGRPDRRLPLPATSASQGVKDR
jgi:hypothetical protein